MEFKKVPKISSLSNLGPNMVCWHRHGWNLCSLFVLQAVA